jgi:DNA gyrase inhibitor GyrI
VMRVEGWAMAVMRVEGWAMAVMRVEGWAMAVMRVEGWAMAVMRVEGWAMAVMKVEGWAMAVSGAAMHAITRTQQMEGKKQTGQMLRSWRHDSPASAIELWLLRAPWAAGSSLRCESMTRSGGMGCDVMWCL